MADGDDELTYFQVGLEDEEVAMLCELAEACHTEPVAVMKAIIRDVLIDSLEEHGGKVHGGDSPARVH